MYRQILWLRMIKRTHGYVRCGLWKWVNQTDTHTHTHTQSGTGHRPNYRSNCQKVDGAMSVMRISFRMLLVLVIGCCDCCSARGPVNMAKKTGLREIRMYLCEPIDTVESVSATPLEGSSVNTTSQSTWFSSMYRLASRTERSFCQSSSQNGATIVDAMLILVLIPVRFCELITTGHDVSWICRWDRYTTEIIEMKVVIYVALVAMLNNSISSKSYIFPNTVHNMNCLHRTLYCP